MCDPRAVECVRLWTAENEPQRKVIMDVIKSRLDLGWPYNYKALDLLGVMPVTELTPLVEKLKSFTETPPANEGSADLKKISKPLYEKAMVEVRKAEEEEARKRQEAITAMWGGLWANQVGRPLAAERWEGWNYPWSEIPPGIGAQAHMQWTGSAPEGWYPYVPEPKPIPNPAWGALT